MSTTDDAYAAGSREGADVSVAESVIRASARLIGARTRREQGLPPCVESASAAQAAAEAIKGAIRTEGKSGESAA